VTTGTFIVSRFSPPVPAVGAWFNTTVGTRTATSTQVTSVTDFGDFAIGQPYSATKLAITSVNGGVNVTSGTPFSIVVQSQNTNSSSANVATDTPFTLSVNTGSGAFGGTVTGII